MVASARFGSSSSFAAFVTWPTAKLPIRKTIPQRNSSESKIWSKACRDNLSLLVICNVPAALVNSASCFSERGNESCTLRACSRLAPSHSRTAFESPRMVTGLLQPTDKSGSKSYLCQTTHRSSTTYVLVTTRPVVLFCGPSETAVSEAKAVAILAGNQKVRTGRYE